MEPEKSSSASSLFSHRALRRAQPHGPGSRTGSYWSQQVPRYRGIAFSVEPGLAVVLVSLVTGGGRVCSAPPACSTNSCAGDGGAVDVWGEPDVEADMSACTRLDLAAGTASVPSRRSSYSTWLTRAQVLPGCGRVWLWSAIAVDAITCDRVLSLLARSPLSSACSRAVHGQPRSSVDPTYVRSVVKLQAVPFTQLTAG